MLSLFNFRMSNGYADGVMWRLHFTCATLRQPYNSVPSQCPSKLNTQSLVMPLLLAANTSGGREILRLCQILVLPFVYS